MTAYYVDGKKMTVDEYAQYLSSIQNKTSTQADAQQRAQERLKERLKQLNDTWKLGFDQRQQEAETNASRAFRYRQQESERDFGQRTAFSRQDFEQSRTLRGDELQSIERRDTAQIAARERMQQAGFGQERDMADIRSRLKQREKSEDRTAAIASYRGRG